MCFLFLLFAIVASTSIYRYTLLYHLCPIPSIESASSFFPTKRFRIKDIRVEYYANKINGRKLSRLFDYDLKSIYVYCYRVNFLSLDIRYFHRTVKNICIYIYFNTTMARVCRKLHFRNKDLEGLLRQPRGIIRTSRVLSAEFSIDVAN